MESHESSTSPLLSPEMEFSTEDEIRLLQRLEQRREERKNIRSVPYALVAVLIAMTFAALFAGPRHPQLHTPGLRKRATGCEQVKEDGMAGAQVVVTTSTTQSKTSLLTSIAIENDLTSVITITSMYVEAVAYLVTKSVPTPEPAPIEQPIISPPLPAVVPTSSSLPPPPEATITQPPKTHTPGEAFAYSLCADSPADVTINCCGEAVRCTAADATGTLWPTGCTVEKDAKTACAYTCQATGFTLTDGTSCKPTATVIEPTTNVKSGNEGPKPTVFQGPAATVTCSASDAICATMEGLTAAQANCASSACTYGCAEGMCATPPAGMVLGACLPTLAGNVPSAICTFCPSSSTYASGSCAPTAPPARKRYIW